LPEHEQKRTQQFRDLDTTRFRPLRQSQNSLLACFSKTAADPGDYGMNHRPDLDGPPLHDLLEGDMMPRDIYDNLHQYNFSSPGGEAGYQHLSKIRRYRGEPEKK